MSDWIGSRFQKGLVSVIIPTYNRAAFLEEALQSVMKQTYRPIECIVVDDGSTDNTTEVLATFDKQKDERLTLICLKQKNAGAPVARNAGTAASNGEYIQYLDSDDVLYSHKLANQVVFLQQNAHCDCVFGDWEKGTVDQRELVVAYKAENFVKQIFTIEKPIVNFSFLMRRSLAKRTGVWDVTLKRMQEIDFQLKAVLAGGNFCYYHQVCGLWRHHENERIHNQTAVKDMLPFFQKWERILLDRQLFSQEMGEKIAGWYMWFISQSKDQNLTSHLPVLEEVVRLNSSIPFYSTVKMKVLRFLVGKKLALYCWMLRYRNT